MMEASEVYCRHCQPDKFHRGGPIGYNHVSPYFVVGDYVQNTMCYSVRVYIDGTPVACTEVHPGSPGFVSVVYDEAGSPLYYNFEDGNFYSINIPENLQICFCCGPQYSSAAEKLLVGEVEMCWMKKPERAMWAYQYLCGDIYEDLEAFLPPKTYITLQQVKSRLRGAGVFLTRTRLNFLVEKIMEQEEAIMSGLVGAEQIFPSLVREPALSA